MSIKSYPTMCSDFHAVAMFRNFCEILSAILFNMYVYHKVLCNSLCNFIYYAKRITDICDGLFAFSFIFVNTYHRVMWTFSAVSFIL